MRLLRRQTNLRGLLGDNPRRVNERLILKPLTQDLVDSYLELFDEEFCSINRWTPRVLKRHLKIRNSVQHRRRLAPHVAVFVLSEHPLDVVGFVSLSQPTSKSKQRSIAAHVGPQHRGQGYMTEILRVVVGVLRSADLGRSVVLATSDDNAKMTRVCEKLGLSYRMRAWNFPDGSVETVRFYDVVNY